MFQCNAKSPLLHFFAGMGLWEIFFKHMTKDSGGVYEALDYNIGSKYLTCK